MPFNPTLPAYRTRIVSAELRDNFTALKALMDAQAAQIATLTASVTTVQSQMAAIIAQIVALGNLVPIGAIIPWFKDTPGVPALPANFVECNGQFLSDPDSPLDGELMPDINTGAQRFLRGGLTSGTLGGIDAFATAQADNSGINPPVTFVTTEFSPGAVPFPPYVTAVYVIRVK